MIKQIEEEVQNALRLCDSATADEIIGVPPEEYGKLIKATKAAYQMLWMLAKSNGMKESKEVLEMGAKGLMILTTLVHYAYALGIKRGRGDRVQDREGGK